MTPDEHELLLKRAFEAYLSARCLPSCRPGRPYLPYDVVNLTKLRRSFSASLIEGELRELTNKLNAWLIALQRWHAWQTVMLDHSEAECRELEHEFVTPLATYCLFQPSALRDTITFVVTNGMHQVLMSIDPTRLDRLPLDQDPWKKPSHPSRRKKEKQLADIINRWAIGETLLATLRKLDDQNNRQATSDFRNRASHSIAPRFSIGFTRMVTRTVEKATRMESMGGGYFHCVPIPDKACVCYGIGGTEPLDLNHAREINEQQFDLAVACFEHYIDLFKATTE